MSKDYASKNVTSNEGQHDITSSAILFFNQPHPHWLAQKRKPNGGVRRGRAMTPAGGHWTPTDKRSHLRKLLLLLLLLL